MEMQFIRVATVLAMAVLASASATSNPTPRLVPRPPLERSERIAADAETYGIAINGIPYGAAGWTLRITNNTDASLSILWDESSFVTAKGESGGRLIKGDTRKIDTAKSQPASPLAPHASLVQVVFIEKLVDAEEVEAKNADFVSPRVAALLEETRSANAHAILGGKLYLVLQMADGRKTWVGHVDGGQVPPTKVVAPPTIANPTNDPALAVTFWCAANNDCFVDESACPGQCDEQIDVWCARNASGWSCARDRMRCLERVDASRDRNWGECIARRAGAAR
jgi:hypothetical protein